MEYLPFGVPQPVRPLSLGVRLTKLLSRRRGLGDVERDLERPREDRRE